ncbi:hypothetical protein Tco_1452502 [Tanacetum coccineum]
MLIRSSITPALGLHPFVKKFAIRSWYVTANMTSRLARGDACNLVFSAQSNSSIHLSDANCLSDKNEQPEAIDDRCLLKVIEDFKSKAGKL